MMQPVTLDQMLATIDQFTQQFDTLVQVAERDTAWGAANLTEANRAASPPLITGTTGQALTAAQLAQLQEMFQNIGEFAKWATSPFAQGQPTPLEYFRSITRVVR
jgi:hypothetical protein